MFSALKDIEAALFRNFDQRPIRTICDFNIQSFVHPSLQAATLNPVLA
ncbi:MAG: hypothetical protein UU84_C0037G0009 [Candidatus Yanofskybacteria bacterium GW2011_GWC2_41_9]|uniref:Uncharacterized protein n=1 Tax=Candidatus Yanofskybacteria bacterium GW2011_GWC2_41_9 TaxID=1619029 RepID=A0A0G0ZV05_9BACT|nr:MAG: hypothetical protein UU84_C0037G0009 [Candidatus Yanofskybacteria bacterium GW2011_GWC2_41_9]